MLRNRSVVLIVGGLAVVATGLGLIARVARAQNPAPPSTVVSAAAQPSPPQSLAAIANQTPVHPPCVVPPDLNDESFASFADLLLLGHAWDTHDSALMTDVALKLAEGERVLLRPHRAIDTAKLFEVIAHVAGGRNDKGTLDRLTKLATARNDSLLTKAITEARKGSDTIEDDVLMVGLPIEDLSHEALVLHQVVIRKTRAAIIAGDSAMLDKIDKFIDQFNQLHPGQHQQFDKLISQAKSRMPKQSTLAPTVRILERLGEMTPCN